MSNIVLSEKLTLEIFSYLDINNLYRATQVCKAWKPLAENLLYKALVHKYFSQFLCINNEKTAWKFEFARFTSYPRSSFLNGNFNHSYRIAQLKDPISQITFNGTHFEIISLNSHASTYALIDKKGAIIKLMYGVEWVTFNNLQDRIIEKRALAIPENNNEEIIIAREMDPIAGKNFFFAIFGEKTIQVWDKQWKPIKTLLHEQNIGAALINIPNTDLLITTSKASVVAVETYHLHLWNVQSGQCLKTLKIPATGTRHSVNFYNGFLFVGTHGGLIFMCDADLNPIRKFKSDQMYSITSIGVSNQWIVASDVTNGVHLWYLKQGIFLDDSEQKTQRTFKKLKITT